MGDSQPPPRGKGRRPAASIGLLSGALSCSALLLGCLAAGPASSWAGDPPALGAPASGPADPADVEVRNNASSLLAQLLDEEKNVSKVLIIKHGSRQLSGLIKAISLAASDGAQRLRGLAQADPTLDLKRLELPAGEKASRDSIATAEEHELLFSSGDTFAFNLLLTQAQALNYGAHLATVAAEHSTVPGQADALRTLSVTLNQLLSQVKAMMRTLPAK